MFEMASDLEKVCIDLTRTQDLLHILLSGVFEKKCEISEYVQQYETLTELALRIIYEQEREVRRVSDMLYEINRQMREIEKTEYKGA